MNPSVLHHVTCASVLTMLTAFIVKADLVNVITQVLYHLDVLQEFQDLLGSAFEIFCDQLRKWRVFDVEDVLCPRRVEQLAWK